jgi:hypothetical protein
MRGLLTLLIYAAFFYLMMRFGCGAHMVHGHGGQGHEGHGGSGAGYADPWRWEQKRCKRKPNGWRIRRSGELPEKGSQETGKRNRFAKANLPGDSAHDCYAGPNKGYRQERAGHVEAQSHRDHDRRLHAGDAGRGTRDSAGNLRGAYDVTKPWKRSKSLTPSDTKREIGISVSD